MVGDRSRGGVRRARRSRTTERVQTVVALLVALLLMMAAPAGAEVHVVVGVDGEGRLAASVAGPTPIRLPASRIVALGGYAGTPVGFRSLDPAAATAELRPVDPGAHLAFELLYTDRGAGVLDEATGVPLRRSDLYKLGAAPFDSHPLWMLAADVSRPSKVTVRLIDRASIHEPGRVMSFTFVPDPTSEAWLCAARCEGQKVYDQPGRCPQCAAPLSLATTTRYTAVVTPDKPLYAGVGVRLVIALRDPSGAPVTVDEGMLDAYVVSADLSSFAHGRPVRNPDGTFHLPATFPASGLYTIFFELAPARVGVQVARTDVVVAGPPRERIPLEPDATNAKTVDGYTVALATDGPLSPLREIACTFSVARGDVPVRNLAPVRGALGQLVVVGPNRSSFLHRAARVGPAVTGPDATFRCAFPAPGVYRAWLQVKPGDTLLTVPFTLQVERADVFRSRRAQDAEGFESFEDGSGEDASGGE